MNDSNNWCAEEFAGIHLGDKRVEARFRRVSSDLLNQPTESIQTASGSWDAAKGAYRLFDNSRCTEQEILRAHQKEIQKRLQACEENVYLAIQDTTTLDYTHHPKTEGLSKLQKKEGYLYPLKGCFLHSVLLITEKGCPLGLLDEKIYCNAETPALVHHKQRPIHEKKSYRWIESLRVTQAHTAEKKVITVCDREADIFEFFVEAAHLGASVIVRAAHNRTLICAPPNEKSYNLWPYMVSVVCSGEEIVHIPAQRNKPEREALLEVRYALVTLQPPQRQPGAQRETLPHTPVYAVWFYERNPPENIPGLEWMLLTNEPVTTHAEALQIAQWYRLRWQIENYHRILKSGCKVEDCRLETYERLRKYITLKSIIAFRLFWLTFINRTAPNTSCAPLLYAHEWKALYCHVHKTPIPPTQPHDCNIRGIFRA